ncbi:MAG: cytochrome c/c1 heme-lyase [Olpidium bornovanus]|uniref:Holocytochrome c-type synthase n=1 Tax=Olpidium bornovanus TaxID=278681 RepID=A0A8H8DKV3_9FUNG|nr:MAG: cytochrome c/c1 heme-lyase [Olpidium bornovanus]
MAVELPQHHSQDRGEEEQQQPKCPVHPSAYKHFVPPPKQQQQQQQHGAVREGDGEDGGALARGAACPVTEHSKSGREAAAAAAPRRAPGDGEGCPVGAEQPPGAERQPWPAETDPRNGMPAAAEQHRAPVQRRRLSTRRELSTIPMAVETHAPPAPAPSSSSSSGSGCSSATTASATGPLDDASSPSGKKKNDASRVWVYPSEQMFFNAMRRKSWDPREEDMKVVVPIHNAVNERCWKEILEWESAHDR